MKQNKKIIGITGGVGSGKSEVLRILKEDFQAKIIIADQVAHDLMEPGNVNYKGIVAEFGTDILLEDKKINRKALGQIVFHNKEKLQRLNQLTHPNVDGKIQEIMKEGREEDCHLIVCEAAILVGAGYEAMFDELWYIFTREEVRRERLKASRGYSDEQIDAMLSNQTSEEEFKRIADVVIDNSDTLERTKEQIRNRVHKDL
ncbi:MAG: dephospho-CoA kinase [Anaerostipes sp.]|nr:dephospho-CoA kinase [Anaerostipes sp.]